MSNQLVEVAAFESPHEAQLAKGMLEANGIPCFIADENIARVAGAVHTALIGGMSLQVRECDACEALSLLGSPVEQIDEETVLASGESEAIAAEPSPPTAREAVAAPATLAPSSLRVICPLCGQPAPSAGERLLLGLKALFSGETQALRCTHCGAARPR